MPKTPIDYSKTIIYKLVHKDDVDNKNVYVGHTTDFRRRKWQHKHCCCNPNDEKHNNLKYQFIRDNGGWDEWIMIEIEKYPCSDVREAEKREREWIEQYKYHLNRHIPTRTQKERHQDNREEIAQYQKEYREKNKEVLSNKKREYQQNNKERLQQYKKEHYEKNKEKIAQKQKEYYENNKTARLEKVKEYREKNKEEISQKKKEYQEKNKEKLQQKKKEYHEKNKEIISQKKREYHEKNKEILQQKKGEKVKCECGSEVSKGNLLRHCKTKKHLSKIQST
tara:strand:+ start:384 stop:1223 length:840 start_codon:yes stop_codon:yes gene_type:complete